MNWNKIPTGHEQLHAGKLLADVHIAFTQDEGWVTRWAVHEILEIDSEDKATGLARAQVSPYATGNFYSGNELEAKHAVPIAKLFAEQLVEGVIINERNNNVFKIQQPPEDIQ